MNNSQARTIAVLAAREGGTVARARLGDPGYLKWKGHRDLVTGSAMEVQDSIVAVLKRECPSDAILAEEGPEDEELAVGAERLWIVDPICGSMNFAQGVPFFAVSIALRVDGQMQVGVVYDPMRDELFEATREEPATLNGQPIAVLPVPDGPEFWEQAWTGTDLPCGGERREEALRVFRHVSREVLSTTIMGSPALGICYVAAGRLHVYWALDAKPWDVAAAGLVVQHAGGIITDPQGGSWLYSDGGYLAATPTLHRWAVGSIGQMRSGHPPHLA